ncbi:Superoxide dismutase [Cu-Zn] [Coemansia nantahalensis]|uniref:Superoxide dismutase [Cu-Zn] n=2 Tax=Coemansia TaxID=4863 RepID=A0ACC1L6J0_9FUNG|nr:Superoxide dismutase [Cu-Zn] [Coemansia nantahalensis]KAJ2801738.1 Superoxide dismutase [Cu-Zn] [Coemansia helicoidea]
MRRRVAVLRGDGSVYGDVYLEQENESSPVVISGIILGLQPGPHGFHIHEFGDNSNGYSSVGPHFNPLHKSHGAPTDENRHMGDLGNVTANVEGTAKFKFTDSQVTLFGPHSVFARSIVIHEKKDDLGKGGYGSSTTTGNAGAGIAYGVIGIGSRI